MWNNEDDQERLSHTAADSKRGLPARGDSHSQICGIRIEGLKSKVLKPQSRSLIATICRWKTVALGKTATEQPNSIVLLYCIVSILS